MKPYKPPSRFMEWLSRVPSPSAWTMLRKYDPRHDMLVRNGLVLGMIRTHYSFDGKESYSNMCTYTVRMGEFSVWVENYPYGYGVVRNKRGEEFPGRPSWRTIKLLRKEVFRLWEEVTDKHYYGE